MQLAKIQLARSIWLFDTGELNPYGASIFPQLIAGLVRRYKFRKYPDAEHFPLGTSLRFEVGQFVQEDGSSYEVALEIFSDGIAADSRHSTQISDLFIIDVVQWVCGQFNLVFSQMLAKKRTYRSELVVYSHRGLGGICGKFDQMAEAVSSTSGSPSELTAITFGSESTNSLLTFERKLNEPFENQKFYSSSSLDTQSHLALLNTLALTVLIESEGQQLAMATTGNPGDAQ